MWQMNGRRLRRHGITIGIAVTASVVVSAGGASLLMEPTFVALPYTATAAIDESNTTVGFADSNLYFMSPADIDRTLDEMQAMGVNNVRIGIPWAGIEPIPGYYNWSAVDYLVAAATERDMGILAVINTTPSWASQPGAPQFYSEPADPSQFGAFAGLAAERYAGQISAYEIWNEPNAAFFYGPEIDPAGYAELLQAAYPEIKAADPDATVIGGVVGSTITYEDITMNPVDFVAEMYAAGAQGYFDALSFHPYQYTTPFTEGGYHPDSPVNQLDDIRDLMVENGDSDKLVWASEYGLPTSEVTEAHQAAYIEDFLEGWSDVSYTGPAFIYTTRDTATGSTNPEDTFGVIRTDWTWKPAAFVIQEWNQTHPQTADPVTLAATTAPTTATVEPVEATAVPQSALTTGGATALVPASIETTTAAEATVEPVEATLVPPSALTTGPTNALVPAPIETSTAAEAAPTETSTEMIAPIETETSSGAADTGPADTTVEPVDGAATTEPTDSVTDPADEADATDPVDSTYATDATGTADATDATGATDSTDSTSSTDGTNSDSTESGASDATDSTDSSESRESADAAA
jgi:polysaccharide biosynthesis protein PslG